MKKIDDTEQLKPYFDSYQEFCPNKAMSAEFVIFLQRYVEKNKDEKIENAVKECIYVIKRIQDYIDAAKKADPEIQLSLEDIDILGFIRDQFKSESIDYGLNIFKIMRANINEYKKLHPDESIGTRCRAFFGYLAQTQPQLSPPAANLKVESIQNKLSSYLNTTRHFHLDFKRIKYLLWVATEYPQIPPQEALHWVGQIASSTTYRLVSKLFPTSYPFYYMSFKSDIRGTAHFRIYARTLFCAPFLFPLLSIAKTEKDYSKKGIDIDFDLRQGDTPQSVINTIDLILDEIETTLLPHDESKQIFHDSKRDIQRAAKEFCKDFAQNFPGLTYHQMRPPEIDAEENTSTVEIRNIRNLISQLNYDELARKFATGLCAKNRHFGDSMLEQISSFPGYDIYLLCGQLKSKHSTELFTSYDDKQKDPSKSHRVIISKQGHGYYIHWCMAYQGSKFINSQPLTAADDIHFLDTLTEQYFARDESYRQVSIVQHCERLFEIILPYVQTSLERERKNQASIILKMVAMMMEYGADPGDRRHPDSQTIIERLIDKSDRLDDLDEVQKKFLCDFIRLIHYADHGRSQLRVDSYYEKHFLGIQILDGEKAMAPKKKLPPQIRSICNVHSLFGDFLEIINYQHTNLYLQTIPLSSFTDEEQIIDLCARVFPSRNNLSKEEFEASIKRKLQPSKDIAVIDLLYDNNGKIAGFNIAVVVFPKKSDAPLLHYIRLAACEKFVQNDFRELMSQISFQRILFLKKIHSGEILNCYASVSAKSYLQVAKLPELHPKQFCIREQDLQYFLDVFYPGNEISPNNSLIQFPSRLFYHDPEKQEGFFNESDINCIAYNTRYEKQGFGTLVAFYASPANLKKLAQKIKTQLNGEETFQSIAERTYKMNTDAMRIKAKF